MRLPYNEESENKLTPFELDLLKQEEQRKSMRLLSDFTQGKLPFEASHPLPKEGMVDIQITPDNKEVVINESLVKAPKLAKLAPEKQALVKKLIESPNTSAEVKQQLNKYVLEGYSAEDRKAISESGNDFTDRLPAMLAALGAGVGKRDPVGAASTLDKMRVDERNQRLKDFDTEKVMKQAELDDKAKDDPLSERSYEGQTILINEYGVPPEIARKMPARLIEARLPHIKARMDREFREKQLQSQAQDRALQREIVAGKRSDEKKVRALEAYNKDPGVRKLRERQDMADNAEALLSMSNPVADEAVGTQLARMAGEVGNLTEGDISRFKGSQDIVAKARRFATRNLTGRIPESDRKDLQDMVRVFKAKNRESDARAAEKFSKQYGNAYGMEEGELREVLTPGYRANEIQSPQDEEAASVARRKRIEELRRKKQEK